MADYPVRGEKPWDNELREYIEELPVTEGPFKNALEATVTQQATPIATAKAVAFSIALGG